MRQLVRIILYMTFTIACFGVVAIVVFLESQTDLVSDVRVALGLEEGEISNNSLAFDTDGSIVARVANWRAYSGPNRHLPTAIPGWARTESEVSHVASMIFRATHAPELAQMQPDTDLALLAPPGGDGGVAIDVGVVGGAAEYSNGEAYFLVVLQRVPHDYDELIEPARMYLTEVEKADRGIVDTAIGGRVFRYKASSTTDGPYLSLSGPIGEVYLLTVEGTAPMAVIEQHIEQIDFQRLEEEGAIEADPMASLTIFGDVLKKANGFDMAAD